MKEGKGEDIAVCENEKEGKGVEGKPGAGGAKFGEGKRGKVVEGKEDEKGRGEEGLQSARRRRKDGMNEAQFTGAEGCIVIVPRSTASPWLSFFTITLMDGVDEVFRSWSGFRINAWGWWGEGAVIFYVGLRKLWVRFFSFFPSSISYS